MAFLISIFLSLIYAVASKSSHFTYETKYLDIPIDHFTLDVNETFKLRILINEEFWDEENGPIYLYTGGEDKIDDIAYMTGFLWESAQELNALIVYAEHRYYGESMPFGDLSLTEKQYFKYLTTDQILADFVDVIYFIKSGEWQSMGNDTLKKKFHNPVIAFGGSYGGILAAWLRMKYPTVVIGALSSSAPMFMFNGMSECDIPDRIVTIVFNSTEYSDCAKLIRISWDILTTFTSNVRGKEWLSKNWKLCSPVSDDYHIELLKEIFSDFYRDAAISNYPYEADVFTPLPANPVQEMCSRIKNSSDPKEFLMSIFDAGSVYFNWTGNTRCLNWENDLDDDNNNNLNPFYLRWCTEFYSTWCSTGIYDMFEPKIWNYEENSDYCYKTYKVRPVVSNVHKTTFSNANLLAATNIIFSNGLKDPWSGFGILKNLNPTSIAVLIPDSACNLDLRSLNSHDPISVHKARMFYNKIFKKWIEHYYSNERSNYYYEIDLQELGVNDFIYRVQNTTSNVDHFLAPSN